ncbi:MAG: hypothetical protein KF746_08210 [Chitinophagaceae bacterium]|nr:hypothetical protein [Chitinophagaceae bacterium]
MKKDILDAILAALKKDKNAYQSGLQTLDADTDIDENALVVCHPKTTFHFSLNTHDFARPIPRYF